MPLSPGTRLGPYEITGPLGAGGMGEVYRARDKRLGRDVAIKILSDAFTHDRDRLARFEREARVLAALNHPNIAAIYGVAEDPDPQAGARSGLVLELVEGETLSDRIARGPIAIGEALRIARQIADALEAAHQQHIVHRDLKPANVRLTPAGLVKVLDFGLAKALGSDTPNETEGAALETATAPMVTSPGMVLGTTAYMSPEQARGQEVDERTDIWALGCVLFEMLVGRRVFGGATTADMLAAVVEREPDWNALPSATPPLVRRLLKRCLRKIPKERLQHAGDARLDLDEVLEAPVVEAGVTRHAQRGWSWIAIGIIGVLAIATAALAVMVARARPARQEVRFEMSGTVPITPVASVAISPDGTEIVVAPAFESIDAGSALWLRPVDSIVGRTLAGTEGAFLPFWSPDGRSIGFFANHKLMRVDIQSGVVKSVADAPVGRGAAWSTDGSIVFAPTVRGPLQRVSSDGGTVTPATTLESGQNDHRSPQWLPNETHFLYFARGAPEVRGVFVAQRDGTGATRLLDADAPAVFAPPGHLLFVRETTLFAQPFDAGRLELTGPAVAVADSIPVNPGVSLATLAASPAGTIVYGVSSPKRIQLAWFDRQGKRLGGAGPQEIVAGNPSLSPDGRSVALNRVIAGNWDIWILDLERNGLRRVTSDPQLEFSPIWMPDGQRVIYQSGRSGGGTELRLRVIDGTTPDEVLVSTTAGINPTDVSKDGGVLLYDSNSATTASDIWAMSLTGDRHPRPIVQTAAVEREGQFSPDGHWMAYSTNLSGQSEVYVQPFPGPGKPVPVSAAGGNQLRWSPRGSEIFYIDPKGLLTAVPVTIRSPQTIEIGKPTPLFPTGFTFGTQGPRAGYVVSSDGQRFLLNASADGVSATTLAVILNWRGRP